MEEGVYLWSMASFDCGRSPFIKSSPYICLQHLHKISLLSLFILKTTAERGEGGNLDEKRAKGGSTPKILSRPYDVPRLHDIAKKTSTTRSQSVVGDWFNRLKRLTRRANMKEANKQAKTYYIGRSLTLCIFCFMLIDHESHNRNAFIG